MTMKIGWQPQNWLAKKSKFGFRGYPIGTVAYYGRDDRRASKVAVAIVASEHGDPVAIERWHSEASDVRTDTAIIAQVVAFLKSHAVHSVARTEAIIGCPHEEGIDYEGKVCPHCPFWADRDRFAGARAHVLAGLLAKGDNDGGLP
jgi:hypothetical protein